MVHMALSARLCPWCSGSPLAKSLQAQLHFVSKKVQVTKCRFCACTEGACDAYASETKEKLKHLETSNTKVDFEPFRMVFESFRRHVVNMLLLSVPTFHAICMPASEHGGARTSDLRSSLLQINRLSKERNPSHSRRTVLGHVILGNLQNSLCLSAPGPCSVPFLSLTPKKSDFLGSFVIFPLSGIVQT